MPRVSPRIATIVFGMLAFGIPIFFLGLLSSYDGFISFPTLIYPLFTILYTSWQLARKLRKVYYNYIQQFLYVYLYVNFGIAAGIQLALQRYPWMGNYSQSEVAFAYAIIALGVVAFELTPVFLCRILPIGGWPRKPERWSGPMPFGVLLATGVFGLLGIMVFWLIGWQSVVFSTRLEAGETIGNQLGESSVYQIAIRTMYSMPLAAGIIFMLSSSRMRAGISIAKLVTLGIAAIFIAFAIIVGNPISTARFWFATVALASSGTFIYCHFPKLLRWLPIVLILGYLFLYPLADAYRSESELKTFQQSALYSLRENYREAYLNGDFDSLQQVMNTISVVNMYGPQLGRQLLGSLLFWVPRPIWPEKPMSSGLFVGTSMGYRFINLSCPLWAEGFLDFHLPGVILLMSIYALSISTFQSLAVVGLPSSAIGAAFQLIFGPYSIYFLRGDLMPCFAYIAPTLFMMGILYFVARTCER